MPKNTAVLSFPKITTGHSQCLLLSSLSFQLLSSKVGSTSFLVKLTLFIETCA